MVEIFKIIGAIGLLLISIGIIVKRKDQQDILFIIGGILLEIYSISIKDVIFILLQIIFILAAVYDYNQNGKWISHENLKKRIMQR